MPFPGIPRHLTGKMDSCIASVRKKNPKLLKTQAIKICRRSVVGGKSLDDVLEEFFDVETGGRATAIQPAQSIPAPQPPKAGVVAGDRGGQQMTGKAKKKAKPKNKKRKEGRRRPRRYEREKAERDSDQEMIIRAIQENDPNLIEVEEPVEVEVEVAVKTPDSDSNLESVLEDMRQIGTALDVDIVEGESETESDVEVEGVEKFHGAVPVVAWTPFGGAETWDDLDEFLEAADFEQTTRQATFEFGQMVGTVLGNPEHDLAEKGNRVAALANGLTERAEDLRDEKDILVEEGYIDTGDYDLLPVTGDETFAGKVAVFLKQRPTKKVDGVKLSASDFASVGDPQKPQTWKLPLAKRAGVPDASRVSAAITAMQPGGFRGQRVKLTAPKKRVVSRIRGAINRLKVKDDVKATLRKRLAAVKSMGVTSFMVFKDQGGQDRWFGWVTNRWRDQDASADPVHGGEILTDDSHKDFVAWVDKNPAKRMPQLWPWHTKELAHKHRADWIDYAYGFLLMSGPLDKDEAEAIGKVAEEWDLGMSHGFYAVERKKDGGLITKYRSFEVSYVPIEFAANQWTDFVTIMKEATEMGMNAEKRAMLEKLAPEGFVDELDKSAGKSEAMIDNLDVDTKGADGDGETEVTPEVEVVEGEAEVETEADADADTETVAVEAEVEVTDADADADEEPVEKDPVDALRKEVGEAIGVIGGEVKVVADLVKGLVDKVDTTEQEEADATAKKEAEAKELTPAASLVALAKSAIGQDKTKIEDGDKLGEKGPEEAEPNDEMMMGVPLLHSIKRQNIEYQEQHGRAPGGKFSVSGG